MKPTTTPFPATLTSSVTNLHAAYEDLLKLDEMALADFVTSEKANWVEALGADFLPLAHDHQLAPERANSGADWTSWLILGGRGAGKTRAGAQWVRDIALNDGHARIALIGETERETRQVMVEGVSGLLAVHGHDERPQWLPSQRLLRWRTGAVAQLFSAEDPESLRGPQFSAAWCDELAKWRQVFGLGQTAALSGDVAQWAMIVLTAYFGGRSLEKVARILARK